ncbi:ATP-binding protein [Xenorhabdus bovienii]|uniref:ATP-binding protein n=1 Tax=Xenorhabdus bovienii TaxID=40576 RepID=UPI0023B34297|nr:ATP-binding protein [Xenorhabdus bovienii]MDE9447648.1 ATP-binding protein [Xenorhabdus bovienii]
MKTTSDHLDKIAKDTPIRALSELIWNSFDAKSTNVNVHFIENELGSIDRITVADNGNGIEHNKLDSLFGSLGDSWKKSAKRSDGYDYLHGENGQGRFKSFSLGDKVEWDTVYTQKNEFYQYKISANSNDLLNFNASEIKNIELKVKGTTVTIYNVEKDADIVFRTGCSIKLAEIFSMYLSKYKNKKLFLNGEVVSPELAQKCVTKINVGDVTVNDNLKIELILNIVEWNDRIKSHKQINYCNTNGFTLHEEKIGKKMLAADSNFTIFAESDYFRECYDKGILREVGLSTELMVIQETILDKTKEFFIKKNITERSEIVRTWIDEKIYPYEDVTSLNPVIEAEKKVFDILAVNVQTYLKKFNKADKKTKSFTFKLLKQAIETNPESVQKIVNEVLELSKEDQNDLASLLDKTTLSAIIGASNIVANRLDFLNALEHQIFDKKNKERLLERDQLHKIIEKEAWIFKE